MFILFWIFPQLFKVDESFLPTGIVFGPDLGFIYPFETIELQPGFPRSITRSHDSLGGLSCGIYISRLFFNWPPSRRRHRCYSFSHPENLFLLLWSASVNSVLKMKDILASSHSLSPLVHSGLKCFFRRCLRTPLEWRSWAKVPFMAL